MRFCQPEAGFQPDIGRAYAEHKTFIFNTLRRTEDLLGTYNQIELIPQVF